LHTCTFPAIIWAGKEEILWNIQKKRTHTEKGIVSVILNKVKEGATTIPKGSTLK